MRFELVPERSQVWIDGSSSIHPVRATATGLEGWFQIEVVDGVLSGPVAGRVEIDVERLRSGNGLVDRETRRRIDARRHPHIVGEITTLEAIADERITVAGRIVFRGRECDVEGELVVRPDGAGLRLEGSQTFDVRDWGLEPPSLLAIRVHPEVTVRVVVEARPA